MGDEIEGRIRLLIAVLPLFEFSVAQSAPDRAAPDTTVHVPDIRTIRLHTFFTNFLFELYSLRNLLHAASEAQGSLPTSTLDDYSETLAKVLILFDSLVNEDLPYVKVESNLKLADQTFRKLDALHQKLQADKDFFASTKNLITLPTGERSRHRLLSRITKYNQRLTHLLEDHTEPASEALAIPLHKSPPYEVREILQKLWGVLVASLQCMCTNSHQVKLRLASFGFSEATNEDGGRYLDLLLATHGSPPQWLETKMRVQRQSSRKVTFESENPRRVISPEPQYIKDLCSIVNSKTRGGCYFLVHPDDGKLRKSNPQIELNFLPISDSCSLVSLKHILSHGARARMKEKRMLGVILAYSMLYIGESKWLRSEWTSEDVCFIQSGEGAIDPRKPYLSINLPMEVSNTNSEMDHTTLEYLHPAPSILSLGIVLMELEFGHPIESLWRDEDLINGETNVNTKFLAATRILHDPTLWDDVTSHYKSAVVSCVEGTFLRHDAISDDLSFQMALYASVVVSLEEELSKGFGIEVDMLDTLPYNPTLQYGSAQSAVQCLAVPPIDIGSPPTQTPIRFQVQNQKEEKNLPGQFKESRLFDTELVMSPDTDLKASLSRKFFKGLKNIHDLLEIRRTTGDRPVKIAILDTGVSKQLMIERNIHAYRDFVEQESIPKDNTGHGSHMLRLLKDTAPDAQIYVARVFSNDFVDADASIRLCQAIKYARDMWKVDIISMAFGFDEADDELDVVIGETRHTLMFAAASNSRTEPLISSLARIRHRVICVNAADMKGNPLDSNPLQIPMTDNFSIVGKDVFLAENEYGSGTSIATTIAAGVAALVLQFSRQKSPHQTSLDISRLTTTAGMSSVLRAMSAGELRGGFKFIQPTSMLLGNSGKGPYERAEEVCESISQALQDRSDNY